MDPPAIAERATHGSVTAERLPPEVTDELDPDEVPHHLLLGESLDVTHGGPTEREFPRVDGDVAALVTDSRLLVVVPRAVGARVEDADLGAAKVRVVSDGQFDDLEVSLPDRSLHVNVRSGEDPAAFVDTFGDVVGGRQTYRRSGGVASGTTPEGERDDARTTTERDERDESERSRLEGLRDRGIVTDEEFARRVDETDPGETDPDETDPDETDPLERLASLRERGAISEAEYERRREEARESLERLASLNERGIITDEELAERRAELLE
jgi:hypothetical protein